MEPAGDHRIDIDDDPAEHDSQEHEAEALHDIGENIYNEQVADEQIIAQARLVSQDMGDFDDSLVLPETSLHNRRLPTMKLTQLKSRSRSICSHSQTSMRYYWVKECSN